MRYLRLIITLLYLFSLPAQAFDDAAEQKKAQPNILVIVVDDMGYTDVGAFGGEIPTPTIDSLAAQGIRFTNFHVLPTCAPTRSVLLTGTDNHTAGIGAQVLSPGQVGQPGYEGYLSDRVVTTAEVLGNAGYHTYMSGKWHLGMEDNQSPHARGFQETFVLASGGGSHFSDAMPIHPREPVVYRRNGKVVPELPKSFYSTIYYTDMLLSFLDRDRDSGKPFFAYLAYTAPHDPLQAPRDYIQKYQGKYDAGYEDLREKRHQGLKAQGPTSELWRRRKAGRACEAGAGYAGLIWVMPRTVRMPQPERRARLRMSRLVRWR